jgi:hypothetical protein
MGRILMVVAVTWAVGCGGGERADDVEQLADAGAPDHDSGPPPSLLSMLGVPWTCSCVIHLGSPEQAFSKSEREVCASSRAGAESYAVGVAIGANFVPLPVNRANCTCCYHEGRGCQRDIAEDECEPGMRNGALCVTPTEPPRCMP